MKIISILFTLSIISSSLYGQIPISKSQIDSLYHQYLNQIEIPKKEALKKLPELKNKFITEQDQIDGLYFVVIMRDSIGLWEQVYMLVSQWDKDTINATLASEMNVVKGYPYGSTFLLTENNIVDWLLIYSDGKEEGNYIVKYLENIR